MNQVTLPASLFVFQRATLAARSRLNDSTIGTRVREDGFVQVVRVTYPDKRKAAVVTPVSDYLRQDEALAFLNSMQ